MRGISIGLTAVLLAAAVRADDVADQPALVLQSGGHTAPVWKVLFTPDGKEVLSISEDKTVRRWDAATGERLGVFRVPVVTGHAGELRAGALSPDGKTLAVAGIGYGRKGKAFSPIYLIDVADGRVAAVLDHEAVVYALAFSHDGKLLASGGHGGTAFLWDVASGQRLRPLEGHTDVVWDLAFSPDDKALASASGDKTAAVWSAATGKMTAGPLKHEDAVQCVAWQNDAILFTGGFGDAAIHKWDRRGKPLQHFDKLPTKPGSIWSLGFVRDKDPKKDKTNLFYAWHDLQQSGWAVLDVTRPEASPPARTWDGGLFQTRGAVSPDGKLAALSGGLENPVVLWTITDGKMVRALTGRGRTPFRVGWAPDGQAVGWTEAKTAFTGGDEALTRTFHLAELHFGRKPDAPYGRVVHARGDLRLELPDDRTVEARTKTATVAAIKTALAVRCYTLLPGDRAAVAFGNQLNLYDARTGKMLHDFRGPAGGVWDLAPSPDGRYLLGAFGDQTLRIWEVDKPAPLLSLFVAGADWVAWTQKGYYAASPAGEKLMGWQVNNGLEQLGAFYPAAQFHKAFYRPDVIRRVLAEGSVEKAVAAADKESGATTEALDVAKALPPEVQILTPAAGKLDKAEVEVKAQAQSKDRPVVTMHLLMDGRPAPGAGAKSFVKGKPGEKQEATWRVTLPEGEHHLVALAETDASLGASPEIAVSGPAAAQEPLPALYVLTIGINAYPGSLKLNWAVDDAAQIRKAFAAGGAPRPYGKVETRLLLDRDASREGVLAGLDWLKQKMTADDTAVVFYAGHGHRDKKTGQFYLLPQDVDVSDLPKTGVTGTQLKDKLQAVPGRVLVLLDACHSGSIGQSPADPASLTDDVQRQLAAPDCGVVVLCAAMAQEEAGEAAAVKHGFFTAALLSGLGGKAPASKDGLIHLTALNFYVEEEVAELSKDEQHVVVDRPSTVTSFPLVRGADKPDGK